MKRLKLKAVELGANEVLTREQLKGITGGILGTCSCTCPDGVTFSYVGTPACNQSSTSECGAGNTATCTWGGSIAF